MADRSYVHDNGFLKIVLIPSGPGTRTLRLHIWPDGGWEDTNIHNHCWPFTSLVLVGQLEFEEYKVDAGGDVEAVHYAYIPSGDLDYDLKPQGTALLKRTRVGARRSGELYDMYPRVLHRTGATRGRLTATLLMQGDRVSDRAEVYVTRRGNLRALQHNEPLKPVELREHLRQLRRLYSERLNDLQD